MTRAEQIAGERSERSTDDLVDAACAYFDDEIGEGSLLSSCARRGVAYHHAGLSQEARLVVEALIQRGYIDVVCGTTTLAQGVNFPISSVLVESLRKGNSTLSYSDFWNIAGRAGRALMDPVGVVAFPTRNPADRHQWEEFLRGEASAISSSLASLIGIADELVGRFDLQAIRQVNGFSGLLQFLAHALRVSGSLDTADEIEDLLRASLFYNQAARDDPAAAEGILRLCRSYLAQTSGSDRGFLALADQTGFATPSVGWLMARSADVPELRSSDSWSHAALFGSDTALLQECVGLIADIPEISLGERGFGSLNTERVARIIRDWVNGASLEQLAHEYGPSEARSDRRVATFARYLHGQLLVQASWGMGALEAVCLGGREVPHTENDAWYVPSMVYFGVPKKEAVWLRMVGLPRAAANGAADMWRGTQNRIPLSHDELRGWIDDATSADWGRWMSGSGASGDAMQLLWKDVLR